MTVSQSEGSITNIKDAMREILALRDLLDGAYDIVEIWAAITPAQKKWKEEWLALSRKHGAIPSP